MGFIKKISLAGIVTLGLNFAISNHYLNKIDDKITALKEVGNKIEFSHPDNKWLNVLADDIKNLEKPSHNLFRPFWNLYRTNRKLDNLNEFFKSYKFAERREFNEPPVIKRKINTTTKRHVKRTINIGYAMEGQNLEDFILALEKANNSLKEYGINVVLKESIKVDHFFREEDDFSYGVRHSFFRPHDFYFMWSDKNFKIKKDDIYILASTEDRVCLIDQDFPKGDLDKVITQEILRLFTKEMNTIVKPNDNHYFVNLDKGTVTDAVANNLDTKFSDPEYKLDVNLEMPRILTVSVGLDGITKEYAQEIISSASERFSKKFNISFVPVEFQNGEFLHPDVYYEDKNDETKKLMETRTKKSDIYVLFTNKDGEDMGGFADVYAGFFLVEEASIKDAVHSFEHEVGHLFYGKHVYFKGSIMGKHSRTGDIFRPKTIETILKNKFRTWRYSN